MFILYLFIGIILGGALAALGLQQSKKSVEAQLLVAQQQTEQERARKTELQTELDKGRAANDELQELLSITKSKLAAAEAKLEAEQQQNAKETQLRQQQFQEQLKTVQEQFANLANKVLEQTSDKLKNQNTESMDAITKPLKENIEKLHEAIAKTNSETARSTATLAEQLKNMTEQTDKIGETANRLTNVIRGGNKEQGNWGERRLSELLDSQGLVRGVDYDVQQTITDAAGNAVHNEESGRRMIPDVVLHYPNNEDVIVDAKVSIDAYYQYMNTEDTRQRDELAKSLVQSIRKQVNDLARKDYSHYIQKPRHAIDFVIMYVPFEGAWQLALSKDPKIWGEAFDRQVLITRQQSLIAIVKMIQIAWRQYTQSENQKHVFELAEELLKRVGDFVKKFEKVGKDLASLQSDYEDAFKKVYTGRQSIVQKANELKQIGVKETAKMPIPETQPGLDDDAE